jgi:manganese-dependent inorganic pyrophosphatase
MIYVIGHKNPDMDSIASAIGYAWLKLERDGIATKPARAGALNAQSKFALSRFETAPPVLLEDAAPRFHTIATQPEPVRPDTPLAVACARYTEHEHPVPVVDDQGSMLGLVTGQQTFKYLMRNLDHAGNATMQQILDVPCIEAADRDVPAYVSTDRIKDQMDGLVRTRREYFLVQDIDGKYAGMCTRSDMLRPPRLQLILVDHNEAAQAVNGLVDADLLEVLDHHRIGNVSTAQPISFHVDVVGSCSTLIAERMRLGRITPPPAIAGLLLSGLLSDTLIFRSPTTTARDKSTASWLSWAAFGVDDAEQKMLDYGRELLMAGAEVAGRTARDLCTVDFKEFEAGKVRFGVSQCEVTNFAELAERMDEIRAELRAQQSERGLAFTALMITDIVMNNSMLVLGEDTRLLGQMPFARLRPGIYDMPGVVSRKKQLMPALIALLTG